MHLHSIRVGEVRVGEVYTLYVEPDFQNRGLGRRLREIRRRCGELGLGAFDLQAQVLRVEPGDDVAGAHLVALGGCSLVSFFLLAQLGAKLVGFRQGRDLNRRR